MPKTEQFSDLALGPKDPKATLYTWLYDEIRAAILEGKLPPGTRLPSSRSISAQHGVARGTVVSALEQLTAEGYLNCRVGSGSFVKGMPPDRLLEARRRQLPERAVLSQASLSARGRCMSRYHFFPVVWVKRQAPAFRTGEPALSLFPTALWSRVAARCIRRMPSSLLSKIEPFGYRPLRAEIADYLGKFRGIKCSPDEVMITSGTQQSLDLVGRLLLDRQDKVWMEDPGYPGALSIFRALGADIIPVPVDDQGLVCSLGRRRFKSAKLAYVTPSHQFPLGATLSQNRRLELLQWAREENAWILEDDYAGEFRFAGRPLAALRSLDRSGCVIYSNTFNKVLFSTLRLGYLVVPPRLVEPFAAARAIIDRYAHAMDQAVLCDFIREGHMGHHIRRMRELYAGRLEVLKRCSLLQMEGLMELSPTRSGLQTVGWLNKGVDDTEAAEMAYQSGIETIALSRITIERSMRPGLVLGFAATDERSLRRGVDVLADVLRKLNRPGIDAQLPGPVLSEQSSH